MHAGRRGGVLAEAKRRLVEWDPSRLRVREMEADYRKCALEALYGADPEVRRVAALADDACTTEDARLLDAMLTRPHTLLPSCCGHCASGRRARRAAALVATVDNGGSLLHKICSSGRASTWWQATTEWGWGGALAALLAIVDDGSGDGADIREWVNRKNTRGDTALHSALRSRMNGDAVQLAVAAVLLLYGADPDVTNGEGRTAFETHARGSARRTPVLLCLLRDASELGDGPAAVRALLFGNTREALRESPWWWMFLDLPAVRDAMRVPQRVLLATWAHERSKQRAEALKHREEAAGGRRCPPQSPQRAPAKLMGGLPRACIAEIMQQLQ